MKGFKKAQNNKSEEHFHDEWAQSVKVSEIDISKQFNGITSPEYKEAITLLGDVQRKKVLNLGCGLGEEAVFLALKGAHVYAIDISSKMIEFSKKLAKKYKVEKKIFYYKMSAENLKFKNETFDAVLGCNVLHHVDLKKSTYEIKRVLKKNGVGVFVEPLTYNPIINIYRNMASHVRTDYEHPFTFDDIEMVGKHFRLVSHKEFQLFTLLIFVWFYIGERLHPNKVRYWKKIITDAYKYEKAFKILYTLDTIFLSIFPFLNKYCWVTVIRVRE